MRHNVLNPVFDSMRAATKLALNSAMFAQMAMDTNIALWLRTQYSSGSTKDAKH